MMWY